MVIKVWLQMSSEQILCRSVDAMFDTLFKQPEYTYYATSLVECPILATDGCIQLTFNTHMPKNLLKLIYYCGG